MLILVDWCNITHLNKSMHSLEGSKEMNDYLKKSFSCSATSNCKYQPLPSSEDWADKQEQQ